MFLVEDLPAMKSLLGDVLASVGNYEVVGVASTEAEALYWMSEANGRWDLLIVDLILAEGSGLGVVPRALAINPRADIVVLSAYASDGIKKHLLQAGVRAVFDKVDTEAFVEWLDDYGARDRSEPTLA